MKHPRAWFDQDDACRITSYVGSTVDRNADISRVQQGASLIRLPNTNNVTAMLECMNDSVLS